jgi:SsrA-binding protein
MPSFKEEKDLVNNRHAFYEYHILDRYEAGAVLLGTEVKSIMAGRIQLKESFVQIKDGEVWLIGAPCGPGNYFCTERRSKNCRRKPCRKA